MVAVCDILGFGNLVKNNNPDDVAEYVFGWLRKALSHSIHKDDFPEDIPSLTAIQEHRHIGLAWFSDTILLYTRNDTDMCIQALTSTLSWLVFASLFNENARIRCGVSYGPAVIDPENSVYIGDPIVEAFELEKQQQWVGGAYSEKAYSRIPDIARQGQDPMWWIVPYDVPLKNGNSSRLLAVDWTWGIHKADTLLFNFSQERAEPSEEDWKSLPDICMKWKNTRKFHEDVCIWCSDRQHFMHRRL